MPPREFRFYARAVIERNHLQEDTAALRMKERAQSEALAAQRQMMQNDSAMYAQRGNIIQVQQGMLQTSAEDLSKEQRRKNFWKTVAMIFVAATAVLLVN